MNCHGYSALRMRVASVTVQLNLSKGLRSLSSIGVTAPLLGLYATSIESDQFTDSVFLPIRSCISANSRRSFCRHYCKMRIGVLHKPLGRLCY